MKIIHKAYFLVGILIAAAAVNLTYLYLSDQRATQDSYTLIRGAELQVNLERIDALAREVGSGNEEIRDEFKKATDEFNRFLNEMKDDVPDDIKKNLLRCKRTLNLGIIKQTRYGKNQNLILEPILPPYLF